MQMLLREILNMLYEEKEKIFKYTMLIARTKEQDITTTMDTYMDVIGSYKQQIKEADDRIAYLEGILHL
jgi:hypothetical protein